MIKTALEHFQDIKELEIADEPNVTVEELIPYKCKQVEKALLELKQIKKANPSEAMEQIKTLRGFNLVELNNDENINKSLNIIEQALQSKSLAEECWEIVKNKPFILQKIFENKGLNNQQEYDKKYFWGTITEEEEAKVKEGLK